MKRVAVLVALAFTLAAIGCTSYSSLPSYSADEINKIMAEWMDDTVPNLIEVWGPPDQVYGDGNGGQVLLYVRDRTNKVPASSSTSTYANGGVNGGQFYGNGQSYTTYKPERVEGYVGYRMFWVGTNGLIYNWKWKGL